MSTLGKKFTIEHRLKISQGLKGKNTWSKGRKNGRPSDETIEKIRSSQIGKFVSAATKLRLSESHRGKKQSAETKNKRSLAMRGSKHPNWIADRSQLAKKQLRNDPAYREWRATVYKRDGWKCRIKNLECAGKIEAHHILGWSSFPELRYEINNGITLCHYHHPRKRDDEKRLSPYFQSLVMVAAY